MLLTAALATLAACASGQGTNAPAVADAPTISESKSASSKSASRSASVKRAAGRRGKSGSRSTKTTVTKGAGDLARVRALAAKAAPDDPAEQERLVREFMKWSKSRRKR